MAETIPAGGSQWYLGDILKSLLKTSEWIHVISSLAVFFAFVTDYLGNYVHYATLWTLAVVLLATMTVWCLRQMGKIASRIADRLIGAAILPIVVLCGLFAGQTIFHTPSLLEKIDDEIKSLANGLANLPEWKGEIVKAVQSETGASTKMLVQEAERIGNWERAGDRKMLREELQTFADQINRIQAAKISTDDPQVRALLAGAESDFQNGDFGQARLKTRRAAEMERMAALDYTSRSVAAVNAAANALEHSAQLAELTGRYTDAAEDFADGAKLIAATDSHRAWQMMRGQAHDFYKQGVEHHDGTAARQAVDLYANLVTMATQSHWDSDLQASKIDLDLAQVSLNAISGKIMESAPVSPPVYNGPARPPVYNMRPRQSPWHRGQAPMEPVPQPNSPATEAQPAPPPQSQQSGGLFTRLTDWATRNSSHGAPQQSRQIVGKQSSDPVSPQRFQPVLPPRNNTPRRRHEGVVNRTHASYP
jgi:hypothetical protein